MNALFDGEELRCWVRGKDFTIMPSYLALILNINQPMFAKPPMYDEMEPDLEIFRDAFKENLDVFKWEINWSVIFISRVEVAHNNNVS